MMAVRRPASSTSPTGPVPLSDVLDEALKQLQTRTCAGETGDGILFSGNRHQSVPRRLFTDSRLTPLERNAWQVFRMLLNVDGISAFPTYAELSPYLTSMPCFGKASDETVARALTLLRLTRWLTLVRHRRDSHTGRIQGNLYVLHDEPLTPYEAIQLDPHYFSLVSHALSHASKAIQRVGYHTLKEITEDPLLSGHVLPSRLQVLMQRLANTGWTNPIATGSSEEPVEEPPGSLSTQAAESGAASAESVFYPLRPTSDSEVGSKTRDDAFLRNPKPDRTVRTDYIYERVRTVPRAREDLPLRFPERFSRLRSEQQAGALAALQQVEVALQQPVLDEWDARCLASNIRNPAAYLFGIIQKAMRSDFRAWAGQRTAKPQTR